MASPSTPPTLQSLIEQLSLFWAREGCAILAPYDASMGAGTFHPATGLRALGSSPWNVAYLQPCRRPADGRYGENPNRLQHYYQYQVILKPSPDNVQDLYLDSLHAIGITPTDHDIRFIEDDWESPTMGAWGLGWEVWCDGMEVSQFTYMQQIGGVDLDPISAELTYGIERLSMYIQNVDNVFDLRWSDQLSYRDLFGRSEKSWSYYHFERADTDALQHEFQTAQKECIHCLDSTLSGGTLIEPAWDYMLRASHVFNMLDARGVIGGTERQKLIGTIRALANQCSRAWLQAEEEKEPQNKKHQKKAPEKKAPKQKYSGNKEQERR